MSNQDIKPPNTQQIKDCLVSLDDLIALERKKLETLIAYRKCLEKHLLEMKR